MKKRRNWRNENKKNKKIRTRETMGGAEENEKRKE